MPIRSLLYVPVSSERFLAKAHERGADAIILDLEDAVAPARKDAARARLGEAVAMVRRGSAAVFVRINSDANRIRLDAEAACRAGADGLLVPKTRGAGAIAALADFLGGIERNVGRKAMSLVPMIEDAGAVIAVLDAREGVTEQDLHLIGIAVDRGRALVIAINKWDGLTSGQRREVERQVDRRLDFVPFATVHYTSALHGSGIAEVIDAALKGYRSAGAEFTTPRLNRVLEDAMAVNPPPLVRGRQVRLRYAHQGGRYPPVIVVHGGQAERLPDHYKRYLENSFRAAFKLTGTPVRVELRTGENPFAGRRNTLTPRQKKTKRRQLRQRKKSS